MEKIINENKFISLKKYGNNINLLNKNLLNNQNYVLGKNEKNKVISFLVKNFLFNDLKGNIETNKINSYNKHKPKDIIKMIFIISLALFGFFLKEPLSIIAILIMMILIIIFMIIYNIIIKLIKYRIKKLNRHLIIKNKDFIWYLKFFKI